MMNVVNIIQYLLNISTYVKIHIKQPVSVVSNKGNWSPVSQGNLMLNDDKQ